MPRVSDLLNTHPLVGALPAAVRDTLLSNTKETLRGQGTTLYREGSRPTGIWLVSIGVVKVCPRLNNTRQNSVGEELFVLMSILFPHFFLKKFPTTVDKSEIKQKAFLGSNFIAWEHSGSV
jgi:hypothetical protein